MGYSEAEFFRILPRAVRDFEVTLDNQQAHIKKTGTNLSIVLTVTALPDRQLAMMRLPHIDVKFEFSGFDERERQSFMKNFDKSYQKGGG